MLQHALWLSVSADDQIQLIMNRGWKSRTLIVALLQWLDYKTLKKLWKLFIYVSAHISMRDHPNIEAIRFFVNCYMQEYGPTDTIHIKKYHKSKFSGLNCNVPWKKVNITLTYILTFNSPFSYFKLFRLNIFWKNLQNFFQAFETRNNSNFNQLQITMTFLLQLILKFKSLQLIFHST